MRIVSLTCSNTEIVCALGCADRLVGVDADSDHPPEVVTALPRVGRDLQVDAERVAALEPDLVLASLTVPGHEDVVARLDAKGLPWIAPEPVSLDDVYANIRDIAERLSVTERAERVIAEMRNAIGTPPRLGNEPSILVQWWPKPVIAPGRLSWVQQLIEAAGARNPLGDRAVKSEPLDDERVAELDPDAIVISWCGVQTEKYRPGVVYGNPAWQDTKAVRNRRVHCIPEAFLGRPGPRLAEGAAALRAVVARQQARPDPGPP